MNLNRLSAENIHSLCANQVVVSLPMAVKELVENALDAGADKIDVRIFNYGLQKIDVVDNGQGISSEHHRTVAQRHTTSKLQEFSDLERVKTLGFRGEALNALCSMSDLEICTRCETETVGTLLCYDAKGELLSQTPQARQRGTTVSLKSIFANLPVRFAELERHKVREYTKVIDLLHQYAIVMPKVRFVCTHTSLKGTTTTPINTRGNSMRDAILSLFGSKFVQTLQNIEFTADYDPEVKIHGLISKAIAGNGRSSADRQILAINKRPCDFTKFSRAINEVYRLFSPNQTPAFFLSLDLKEGTFDVNVTPDKRTIFVHDEQELLSAFQEYLSKLWEPTRGQMTLSIAPSKLNVPPASLNIGPSAPSNPPSQAPRTDAPFTVNQTPLKENVHPSLLTDADHAQKKQRLVESQGDNEPQVSGLLPVPPTPSAPNVILYIPPKQDGANSHVESVQKERKPFIPAPEADIVSISVDPCCLADDAMSDTEVSDLPQVTHVEIAKNHEIENSAELVQSRQHTYGYKSSVSVSFQDIRLKWMDRAKKKKLSFKTYPVGHSLDTVEITTCSNVPVETNAPGVEQDESIAIRQLTTCLTQQNFPNLKIIGQFNLGFILTILKSPNYYDIFIVDQHAADEKYRYETLERDTIVSVQPLVCPKRLEMPPHQLQSAQTNQEYVSKNGFSLRFDQDPESNCQCAYLTAVPNVKGKSFTDQDLDELLFLLHDAPNPDRVRCSKMRAIFASKACRTAWMIGTALEYRHMRDIVNNLTTLRQPWNCPHGRPTMRWLYRGDYHV